MSRKQLKRIVTGLVVGLIGQALPFLVTVVTMSVCLGSMSSDVPEEQLRQAVARSFDITWWSTLIGFAISFGGYGLAGCQFLSWLFSPKVGQSDSPNMPARRCAP